MKLTLDDIRTVATISEELTQEDLEAAQNGSENALTFSNNETNEMISLVKYGKDECIVVMPKKLADDITGDTK